MPCRKKWIRSLCEARQWEPSPSSGEKYDDKVRVVRFGESVELCGGTYMYTPPGRSAQFIILSESMAQGIRRIEAITGEKAEEYMMEKLREADEARALFGQPRELKDSITDLMESSPPEETNPGI